MQPLRGLLVVDLTRYLPGPFASRELLRLGARVVRIESPQGDPLRTFAPTWDAALNAGKESVVCDLKAEPGLARALLERGDVILQSFRPGVAERLGVGPAHAPETAVYCSITGFGPDDAHAGHDLNYLGWAGALADTAPSLPPLPIADLAGGALPAVAEILAALLERERTGRGARLTISLTHGAHRLVAYQLGDAASRVLTGGLACYRIYATYDKRWLTVAALEERFFQRLCELVDRADLIDRQFGADQDALAHELASIFETRSLREWIRHFEGEDVGVGPVATIEEAAEQFADVSSGRAPGLGEHTDAWRDELGAA